MMRYHTLLFSARMLRREWRAGDVSTLFYASVMAVVCLTTVVFFIDRIQQALQWEASELMAADLRLSSDRPLNPQFIIQSEALGLRYSQFRSFPSMVLQQGRPKMVEVKAIADAYPLRGELQLSDDQGQRINHKQKAPASAQVWVDQQLRQQWQLHTGDTLNLGDSIFTVAAFIDKEPDRAGDMFSIAPRLMLRLADLAATGLDQEGSRIRNYLLLSGDKQQLAAFSHAVKPLLKPGQRLETVTDTRNEVRTAMRRAEQFFGLVAVVSVLLSLTAIAICARRYAERNTTAFAILRCLGSRQKDILQIFISQLAMIALLAGLIGITLGWLSHYVLAYLLGQLVLLTLPSPSWWPVLPGLLVAFLAMLLVALPPVLQLRKVPVLQALRGGDEGVDIHSGGAYGLGLLLVVGLIYWLAGDAKMAAILSLGLVATLGLLVLLSLLLLWSLRLLPLRRVNAWMMGMRNLVRHPLQNVIQVLAFGVAMMAVSLLTMIRTDVMSLWQDSLPPDVPNRFVINIQTDQVAALHSFFSSHGLGQTELYPIVRARITALKGIPIADDASVNGGKGHLAHEYKLSWLANIPAGNQLISGEWWSENSADTVPVSLEEGIATQLDLGLGDRFSLDIAGSPLELTVTSLRKVQWDSFKPNFYMLTAPGRLDNFPVSYIGSVFIGPNQSPLIDSMLQQFPNLTVINASEVINQVREISRKVSLAIEYMFGLTFITGSVLLLATVRVSYDRRRKETAVQRAIGASRGYIIRAIVAEFSLLGMIAGMVGVLFASITASLLARQLFQQIYVPSILYWVVAVIAGGVITGWLGYSSLRPVLSVSPLQSLR